ncbi:hypothetical protein FRC12_001658 [Ceratobasidium sp. 428]|nr:hypothetical protein FRC12_001658 [Ceratobasidium sp. 428]
MPFRFKPFTNNSPAHAQLQEWADYYHVKLGWEDKKTQTQGVTKWNSYPIIQGRHYSEFTGIGKTQGYSHAAAAERIMTSPGVLDTARTRLATPLGPRASC